MTRQAGMQPGATSSKAGRFQAAKPFTPWPADVERFERVEMPTGEDEPVLYWDVAGDMFTDKALTQPTDLAIVRRVGARFADDSDDDD